MVNLHILAAWNDSTHRRDIETEEHTTHGGDDCQEVDIVNLGNF